ncbi:HAD family hydrolase [Andreprevotia sp. IGB-42]|uniref:HAD family hydrolase n=1 Tax=Andreprevotia sp. IGB-42 TaxID=2497473 RepID=UPI00135CE634|nr:HAD-IA family hydrolase [Andreprevotia sp. IGB-42]
MIKAVLFDLDGTLADTAPDLGAALNKLLAEEGLPVQPYTAIRPIASHGARGLIGLGFGVTPLDATFLDLRVRFLAHYEAAPHQGTVLFDGVAELIQAIADRGLAWGIITNKPGKYTELLMPHLPLPVAPAVVVSGDTAAAPKPDPAPMLHAAAALGIAPEYCLYVGDAERDIEAGRKVGMTTVLANYGYIAETDTPHAWGADFKIEHPLELLAHLPA